MPAKTISTGTPHDLPPLRLELFGGPLLWRRGRTVRISPLQTALLAITFGDRAARIPRASVQRLLWGSHDDKILRHRLSQLVYQTNRTVAARLFEPDGEHIRFHRKIVACDVDEYSRLIGSGDFEKACDLLERGYLAACNHKRTAALADWIEEQRIHKRLNLRRAALAAWEDAEAAHEWPRARLASEVLLRLDPREETILRRVMRARVMAGQVREAEAIYWSFAERADPSGGWTPEPATSRLLKNVRDADSSSSVRTDTTTRARREPPLVGRSSELAALTRNLYRNRGSACWHTIAVCGEAGVGKTRLVREVIRSARYRGYRVIETGSSLLEKEIALGPILEPLGYPWVQPFLRMVAEPWRSSLLLLLPELQEGNKRLHEAALPATGGVSRHLCEAFLRLFTAIAESRHTILFMDGFQWADDATIAVLQFLRKRWKNTDFTLLVAYCEEELASGHMVTRFVQEEALDSQAMVIRLAELDQAAAIKLVRSVASSDTGESRLAWLTRTTGGNPRYLIDLAASTADSSSAQSADERAPVPSSAQQVVTRRLALLDDTARGVVYGLAILGQVTSVDRLSLVVENTRARCLAALDQLHRLRLVDWTPQGVQFRHDVFGSAVYEQIHPTRRAVLHARAAEVLHRASTNPPSLDIARHYALAGRAKLASMCALEAIQHSDGLDATSRLRTLTEAYELSEGARRGTVAAALSRTYYRLRRLEQAVRFGVEALEGTAFLQPSESVVTRLTVARSRHMLGLADTKASLAELHNLEERARNLPDEAVLAAVLQTRVEVADWSGDRETVARELARLGAMDLPGERAARSRILATLAIQAAYGNPDTGLESGHEAVRLARAHAASDEILLALRRHTEALMTCGLVATAHGWKTVSDATTLAKTTGQLGHHALILLALAEWHTVTGNYEIADRVFTEARTLTREMDCPGVRTRELIVRGALAVSRRDRDEVKAVLKAMADARGQGSDQDAPAIPTGLTDALAALEGTLLLESGKLRGVTRIAERHPLGEALGETPLGLMLFHARLRSRTGNLPEAMEVLANALEANDQSRPLVWLRLALEFVRFARRLGEPQPQLAERARERSEELGLGGMAHEFQPFCAD